MPQNVSAFVSERPASFAEISSPAITRVPEKRLSILLVEDSLYIGQLLKEYLSHRAPWMQLLGMARNSIEAAAICKDFSPDIVVFDPLLEGSPSEFTRTIARLSPRSELLAFMRFSSKELEAQLIDAGVRKVLSRRCTLPELMAALEFVSSHTALKIALPPKKASVRRSSKLTPREESMLRLIAEGCSTKEAAARLEIRQRNADKIRQRIMQKLDLHDAVRLTRYAIRQGLVSI